MEEDYASVTMDMISLLEQPGFAVLQAANADEAIENPDPQL